ncbi:MAG: caspase family protein [Bacteroidia bacterium]|nr:caspase family protein [Bacteroidia bacterium]NNJ56751.1 CHAT domain-containing protein [Bacteroidia bacterium]
MELGIGQTVELGIKNQEVETEKDGVIIHKTVIPSTDNDGTKLCYMVSSVSTTINTDKASTMSMSFAGLMIDINKGEIIKNIENGSVFFDQGKLHSLTYSKIKYGEEYPLDEIVGLLTDVTYNTLSSETLEPLEEITIPTGDTYLGMDQGYIKTARYSNTDILASKVLLYQFDSISLEKVAEFNTNSGSVSQNGKYFSCPRLNKEYKHEVAVYDINSQQNIFSTVLKKDEIPIATFIDNNNRMYIYYFEKLNTDGKTSPKSLKIIDISTKKEIKSFPNAGGSIIPIQDGKKAVITQENGIINVLNLETLNFEYSEKLFEVRFKDGLAKEAIVPVKIRGGDFMFFAHPNGISKLFNTKTQKVVAQLFVSGQDWAVIATDGRVDGTAGAFEKLEWKKLDKEGNVVSRSSVNVLFQNLFTPQLLPKLLSEEHAENKDIAGLLDQVPDIQIITEANNKEVKTPVIELVVETEAHGDPIKEVELYVNGKLVEAQTRGAEMENNAPKSKVQLSSGLNVITAKAITETGIESKLDQVKVTYTGIELKPTLHLLCIGINQYKNASYNLNYAVADAMAIKENISINGTTIFENVRIHTLYNNEATRASTISELENIADESKPQDVFIFFYAGHGVMGQFNEKFYLALHNVTKLYGHDEMLESSGLSADELKHFTSRISAQKQIIVLDACQSGGAIDAFAQRGAAEEKAIVQLARSSGAVLLASTGTEQYATEFDDLGHGVFTFALLEGLEGMADGGLLDQKITIKEIEAYLNDQIPILTQKYRGQPQYPRSWSVGQDFPIVIVKP